MGLVRAATYDTPSMLNEIEKMKDQEEAEEYSMKEIE